MINSASNGVSANLVGEARWVFVLELACKMRSLLVRDDKKIAQSLAIVCSNPFLKYLFTCQTHNHQHFPTLDR
jgi:hypothetical protein